LARALHLRAARPAGDPIVNPQLRTVPTLISTSARSFARMRPSLRAWSAFAVVALASCQTYHDRTAAALQSFEAGRFAEARDAFADPKVTDSPFLTGAEAGMSALTAGEWSVAQQHFDKAVAAVKKYEDRAVLGADAVGEELTSLLINESVKNYPGEGYERAQLHAALALTYLARGDLDGVYVETRRANKLLEGDETLYEKKYAAGGFAHFMSAVSYELQRRFDDAYIDYKRMVEKGVGVELAGKALVRIAERLHYDDELAALRATHGDVAEIPPDAAQIVLIAGVGLGPFKVEQTVSLPGEHGLIQVSVPVFVARPQPVNALELRVDDGAPLRTSVIENVGEVARENLADRMAWLALRSALRAGVKYGLTKVGSDMARKKNNEAAGVAVLAVGAIFTAVTEHADTRSWLTAPDSWQAARMFVAPGAHQLQLSASGGSARDLGVVTLAPGETVFVIARTLGVSVYAHLIGGESPAAQASTPPPSQLESSASNEAQP